jgi:Ca2+-binding EF-hand superfamily protein
MKSVFSRVLTGLILAVAIATACDAYAAPKSQYDEEFSKMDRNGDKRLSEQEFMGKTTGEAREKAKRKFKTLDRDDNKSLSVKEYRKL